MPRTVAGGMQKITCNMKSCGLTRQVIPETVSDDNLSLDKVGDVLLDSFERRGIGYSETTSDRRMEIYLGSQHRR